MQEYTVLRKGTQHKDMCEDFIFTQHIADKYFIGAVFDGCSGGKDSHFASTLFAKVLRSTINTLTWREILEESLKDLQSRIFISFYKQLNQAKLILSLQDEELLSTIIFLMIDKQKNTGSIVVMGDGVVVINGESQTIDQNNQPDYLIYHLKNLYMGVDIFPEQAILVEIDEVKDVSIATDGILSYYMTDKLSVEINPRMYLTQDKHLIGNEKMLPRKCNILKNKYGYEHSDDLAIVRIIADF